MPLPTLRRELVTSFGLVFGGAVLIVAAGVLLIVPAVDSIQAIIYLILLLFADVAIFTLFGRYLLERRLVAPIQSMIDRIETISRGDFEARVPEAETQELDRLGTAVNHMAERLIRDQFQLEANIKSLDQTNRALTEARDAMVVAEKMASVGRLGAGIAHEVGNPLGAIIGYLGLLGRQSDDSQRELIQSAEREAQRIDRIVRGLLEYARPRESRVQAIDVNTVVRETCELVRTQGRFTEVEVELALHDRMPRVMADPHQLQQVLVNLLVNATDALPYGRGKVSVRSDVRLARALDRGPARRRGDPPGIDYTHRRRFHQPRDMRDDPIAPTGEVVSVEIADNGPGIPEDVLPQIFEPFVTTKDPGKGTGIGLAVCARLVEVMGGVIRAENDAERGARFTILLPAAAAESATK